MVKEDRVFCFKKRGVFGTFIMCGVLYFGVVVLVMEGISEDFYFYWVFRILDIDECASL